MPGVPAEGGFDPQRSEQDAGRLLAMSDCALVSAWCRAFDEWLRRFPEEEAFLFILAEALAGRRVLSIASGIGLREIHLQTHGAQVTCRDTPDDSLAVIRRMAALAGAEGLVTRPADQDGGGPYDAVLMLSETPTAGVLARAGAALAAGGELILAAAADALDEAGLAALAGPGMTITRRQTWNGGRHVWWGLKRGGAAAGGPQPFFTEAQFANGLTVRDVSLSRWKTPGAAVTYPGEALAVRTHATVADYAVLSPPLKRPDPERRANAVRADVTLAEGGLTVSILDLVSQTFVIQRTVTEPGRHNLLLPVAFPERFQVVVSNHHPGEPGESAFVINAVALVTRLHVGGVPAASQERWWRRAVVADAEAIAACRVIGEDSAPDGNDWFRDLADDPATRLPRLAARLRALIRTLPAGGRVVWFTRQRSEAVGGLTPDELRALLQPWFVPERVDAIEAEPGRRILAVRAQARRERVLLVGRIDRADRGFDALAEASAALAEAEVPGMVVLLSHGQAKAMLDHATWSLRSGGFEPATPLSKLVRMVTDRSGRVVWPEAVRQRIALGLLVPADRIPAALDDLSAERRPVAALAAPAAPCPAVLLEEPPPVAGAARLTAALGRAGIALDLSYAAGTQRWRSGETGRLYGSYLRAGSYLPHGFDRRIPKALADPEDGVAAIRQDGGHLTSEAEWTLLWEERRDSRFGELARILDVKRREKFNLTSGADPMATAQSQWYHEFHLIHWPPPDPAERLTVIDVGAIDRPGHLSEVVAAARAFARTQGAGFAFVHPEQGLAVARQEAAGRCLGSNSEVLKDQIVGHEYLATSAHASRRHPLSPLLQDFVTLMPPDLGRTLEIGAGFGQLAYALSPRARGYVCLDLDHTCFRDLEAERREYGLVCDILNLAFADQAFDSIVANNILEHLCDPVEALRELARVLRVGGSCYALIPLDAMDANFRLPQHLWKTDTENAAAAFRAAGLDLFHFTVVDGNLAGVYESYPSARGLYVKLSARRMPSASKPA